MQTIHMIINKHWYTCTHPLYSFFIIHLHFDPDMLGITTGCSLVFVKTEHQDQHWEQDEQHTQGPRYGDDEEGHTAWTSSIVILRSCCTEQKTTT